VCLQKREDLGVLGEAALTLLREEEHVAAQHVELALLALDRLGAVARLGRDLGRETRGPFVVSVSDGAVEDADLAHTASVTAPSAAPRRSAQSSLGVGGTGR
jgi:hypothetical protein